MGADDKSIKDKDEEESYFDDNDDLGDIIDPEEVSKGRETRIKESFSAIMQMVRSEGGPAVEFVKKLGPDHIHKIIEGSQIDDNHRFELEKSGRIWYFLYTLLILGFILLLIYFLLPNNKDLLMELIKLALTFAGGLGAGYGFKSFQDRND
ncbi:MAG: hypothetical protein WCI88_10570 [Chloroflexota bacterium]